MKALVITFPGSNCDDDTVFALDKSGFNTTLHFHKDPIDLSPYSLVILPGGFSYGDYLRCGAIAALSPMMEHVKAFAVQGGFVMGICNGFQILCESGLLPGAIAKNDHLKFICQDVYVKVMATNNPWTSQMKDGEVLSIPIAHGDGRYVISPEELTELKKNNQILLSYSTQDGKISSETNPNGSLENIAGICNTTKNVFGLMPHPERATDLRSGDGKKFWQSIVQTFKEKSL